MNLKHSITASTTGAHLIAALLAALFLLAPLLLAGCSGGGDASQDGSAQTGSAQSQPGQADATPAETTPIVTAALVSEHPFVTPGETMLLGVTFEFPSGWYMYWNGRNETGLPPVARITAPDGYVVGEPVWPAPQRKVSAGNILDHVYHDQWTLLIPVTAPPGALPGEPVLFEAKLEWLVCREACISENDSVALELRVLDGARPRPGDRSAFLIAQARGRVPEPVSASSSDKNLRWTWEGSSLTFLAPGAHEVSFYPDRDCADPVDLIADGAAKLEQLTVRFKPDAVRDRPVSGVLEIVRAAGPTELYFVHIVPPTG